MNLIEKILAGLLAIVLLLGIGGYAGYHYTDTYLTAQFNTKIDDLNKTAANKLTQMTNARDAAQTQQAATSAKAQAKYDQDTFALNTTIAALRAAHVVFHDPGKPSIHTAGSKSVAGTGSSNIQPGTSISPAATDFLLGFAGRADTVRNQLIACQADDLSIRTAIDQYNDSLKAIDVQTSKQAQSAVSK